MDDVLSLMGVKLDLCDSKKKWYVRSINAVNVQRLHYNYKLVAYLWKYTPIILQSTGKVKVPLWHKYSENKAKDTTSLYNIYYSFKGN